VARKRGQGAAERQRVQSSGTSITKRGRPQKRANPRKNSVKSREEQDGIGGVTNGSYRKSFAAQEPKRKNKNNVTGIKSTSKKRAKCGLGEKGELGGLRADRNWRGRIINPQCEFGGTPGGKKAASNGAGYSSINGKEKNPPGRTAPKSTLEKSARRQRSKYKTT